MPSPLLRLKVEIATVGGERVALNRLPPSASPTREPPEPFTFPSMPELPKSLPWIEKLRTDSVAAADSAPHPGM